MTFSFKDMEIVVKTLIYGEKRLTRWSQGAQGVGKILVECKSFDGADPGSNMTIERRVLAFVVSTFLSLSCIFLKSDLYSFRCK